MRGVIKRRKYFQFFLKKRCAFIIFIKLVLFCFEFKNFFFFKNINFFFHNMFSYTLYNTFFFMNVLFLYNSRSASVTVKDFFFTKKKLKKISRGSFAVFFKKFLKRRRFFFGKTMFNRLQIQKLSNDYEYDYFIKWMRTYHSYISIFSSSHKLWLLRRFFFKRRRVQDFGAPKRKLCNWGTLKHFYEANDWTSAYQDNVIPATTLFLLTYYTFFQKKKFFFEKQNSIYFTKCNPRWFGFFGQFFFLNNFFDFFFIKKKSKFALLQQREITEIYFSCFFRKKKFFENIVCVDLNKNIFFFFKKLFYIYNYCLGVFTRFSLSWSNLRKCVIDDNILFYPTHKQFFFFLKIVKKLKWGAQCSFFFKKLHCMLKKLGFASNTKLKYIRHFYKNTVFTFLKRKKNFNTKILFLYKRFRFFFFKKFLSFQKFFGNNDYLTNVKFYTYLLFTPDSFINNYVLNAETKNTCNKYTNLLPVFFKNSAVQKIDETIEQQLNIYTIYTWYILNIAELKFKKKFLWKFAIFEDFF